MNDKKPASNPYLPSNSSNEPAPFAPYFSEPASTPYGPTKSEQGTTPIIPAPYGSPANSSSQQNYVDAQQNVYAQSKPYTQQGYESHTPQPYYLQQPSGNPSNQLALVAFIVSLSAFIVGIPASIISIVLGHIALHQMKTNLANNRWMAIVALSLGYAGFALMGFIALIWFGLLFSY
jgi:hypothetical protein